MSWRIRILISFPGDNDPDLSLPHHSALELSLYFPLKELGFDEAQFSSVQSLSRVRLFATTAARQASLSITNSRSLLKLMCFESVMPSNHLIL